MHQAAGPMSSQKSASDAVERLMRQAEISRLTRNLKSKLALASRKTRHSPTKTELIAPESAPSSSTSAGATPELVIPHRTSGRTRAKTLDGASPAPRHATTEFSPLEPRRQRPYSSTFSNCNTSSPRRRSSVASMSSVASYTSTSSSLTQPPSSSTHASPRLRVPRVSSVMSISESQAEDDPLPPAPETPPQRRRAFPKTPERGTVGGLHPHGGPSDSDGASLLLHFAHSPGRGVATPRTPDFNLNDYLHFQTPSPARVQFTPRQMQWESLNSALFQPAGPAVAAAAAAAAGAGLNAAGSNSSGLRTRRSSNGESHQHSPHRSPLRPAVSDMEEMQARVQTRVVAEAAATEPAGSGYVSHRSVL